MLVIWAGILKLLVRIANKEDPDLQSDLGLCCLSKRIWQAANCIVQNLEHLPCPSIEHDVYLGLDQRKSVFMVSNQTRFNQSAQLQRLLAKIFKLGMEQG